MNDVRWFELRVTDLQDETASIRSLSLARPDCQQLPGWEAGAHIKVRLPQEDEREYSLVNSSPAPRQTVSPASYHLGVQREEPSRGGSLYMHSLKIGDIVHVSEPVNHFRITSEDHAITLCAGGIGIAPILSMAAELRVAGRQPRLIYAGRSLNCLAFRREVEQLGLSDVTLHCDDTNGVFDLRGLMNSLPDEEALYLCGPTRMIAAAVENAAALEWHQNRLKFESFTPVTPQDGDSAFEVVLKNSDRRVHIPAGKTILDVLLEMGEDPLHDCKRGDCSLCQVGVIDGVPDHRDNVLSAADRAENKIMHICVSRSRTPVLILDL